MLTATDHTAILAAVTSRRNLLIDQLRLNPVEAMHNLRLGFFGLYRELKNLYPAMCYGDLHQALAVAQRADWEQPSPVPSSDVEMTGEEYLGLIPTSFCDDLRQDCAVALLESKPATEDEARTIIRVQQSRAHYAGRMTKQRRGVMHDLTLGEGDSLTHEMVLRMESLTAEDRYLLRARYLDEVSASDLAQTLRISQPTLRKRIQTALENLRAAFHSSPSTPPMFT